VPDPAPPAGDDEKRILGRLGAEKRWLNVYRPSDFIGSWVQEAVPLDPLPTDRRDKIDQIIPDPRASTLRTVTSHSPSNQTGSNTRTSDTCFVPTVNASKWWTPAMKNDAGAVGDEGFDDVVPARIAVAPQYVEVMHRHVEADPQGLAQRCAPLWT
jgi:hypothetical protein